MAEFDIEELLDKNPKAKRHERSIREALNNLHELRALGLTGTHEGIEIPYKGHVSIENAPKPTKQPIRAKLK